ncbi:hypothetical protein GCM10020254_84120 [Streptomyces goshikiensis]
MDLDDRSRVYWRGGDSSVWPDDRGWRRRVVIALMLAGLLGSMALHVGIGWADAIGALTFAQRLVGVLFLLAGAVQGAALPAVVDYWGRRQVRLSGALVLLGVLMTLATTTLLLFLWLRERELIAAVLLFLALWCWSLWAWRNLIREKGVERYTAPQKVRGRGYRHGAHDGYQPRILEYLQAHCRTLSLHPKSRIRYTVDGCRLSLCSRPPLKLYAKNGGGIPVYIVVDDYTVWGACVRVLCVRRGNEGMER